MPDDDSPTSDAAWLVDTMARAAAGDKDAQTALAASTGERREYWLSFYDGAKRAGDALIAAVSSKDSDRTALRISLWKAARDLAGPSPTPVTVAAAWSAALAGLEATHASTMAYRRLRRGELGPRDLDRWVDASARRYRESLKVLADLQRRPPVVLQLNTAQKQVVVGAVVVGGARD